VASLVVAPSSPVSENGTVNTNNIDFNFTLSPPPVSDITVRFVVGQGPGSATYSIDYQVVNATDVASFTSGTVVFPAGIGSKIITIRPIDDTLVESPETVTLTLQVRKGHPWCVCVSVCIDAATR
jgi:hypothetical protein